MEVLKFEDLPEAVTMLTKEVSELKSLLLEQSNKTTTELEEKFLTVQETATFLNLSPHTIYGKVNRGELPVMKRGKRLHFSNIELSKYLKDGKLKTNSELEQEAEVYLSNKIKGL